MIGLGIGVGWATKRRLVNYINELIKQFKDRVAADGGTFEAEQCLKNTLNTLGIVVPPTVITAPVISGSTSIGSVISTTNGVFDGVTPMTYTYQWLLNGSPILGATSSTYTLTGYSNGNLTCKVTATNDFGSANSTSNSLTVDNSFDFTIKTDNLSTGSSTNTQFKLPLASSGTINFIVDWGDGTQNTITTFNQAETLHTYASIGTYNIKIVGTLRGWSFNNLGDRLKILNISKWSGLDISVNAGFFGCSNMTSTATDAPIISTNNIFNYFFNCVNFNGAIGNWDVSNVIDFSQMFRSAPAFNKDIGSWDISNAVNIGGMFRGATFNQNIGSWNISNITNATDFMTGKTPATFSATNLDAIYNGWSSRPVQPNISITFGTAKYTAAGQAGKDILTGAPNNWTIIDGGI